MSATRLIGQAFGGKSGLIGLLLPHFFSLPLCPEAGAGVEEEEEEEEKRGCLFAPRRSAAN